jgi:hypothetical protein
VRSERRVEDRFHDQTQGGLHDAVPHRGNPERAPLARALRNPVASNRLRAVGPVPQHRRQPGEMRVESRLIHRNRHMVHTRRPAIRLHACKSGSQRRQRIDLVNQRVPSSSSDALFERRQHAVRPHLGGRPRPAGADRTDRTSPDRHSRRLGSLRCVHHAFLSLRPFAPRELLRFIATTSALTPAQAALWLLGAGTPSFTPRRSPSVTHTSLAAIPSPTTVRLHVVAFARYPSARRMPGLARVRLRLCRAGSSSAPGRIAFVSYGLVHHLRLLPTSPCDDAVTVDFQAGERVPGEDSHLSGCVRLEAHATAAWAAVDRREGRSITSSPSNPSCL